MSVYTYSLLYPLNHLVFFFYSAFLYCLLAPQTPFMSLSPGQHSPSPSDALPPNGGSELVINSCEKPGYACTTTIKHYSLPQHMYSDRERDEA